MNAGIEPGGGILVERAKAILLRPKEEWPRIADETSTQGEILKGYVLPLAAIGPVATLIGGQVFGFGMFGITWRPGIFDALKQAIVSYALTVAGVFLLAWIANFLATKFEGQGNWLNAFKLVAYGATASFLAGIFGLVPALGVFGLLGLYSLYLFYTGAGPMMKVPAEKALGFTAVTVICGIILFAIVGMIVGRMVGPPGAGAIGDSGSVSGKLNIPGVGSIDAEEMEQAAQRMEQMAKGEIKPVATDKLLGLLPASIGDFERTGTKTLSLGQVGSGVEGTYKSGDYSFELQINDTGGFGGLAGLGAAMGVERSEEDEDGYERMGIADGRWRTEEWDRTSTHGSYALLLADRFHVEASGHVYEIGVLKAAVAEIDEDDLAGLAE